MGQHYDRFTCINPDAVQQVGQCRGSIGLDGNHTVIYMKDGKRHTTYTPMDIVLLWLSEGQPDAP